MKFKIILIFILALLISTATYAVSPITGLRVIGNQRYSDPQAEAGYIYSTTSIIAWDAVPGATGYDLRFAHYRTNNSYDKLAYETYGYTTNNTAFNVNEGYKHVDYAQDSRQVVYITARGVSLEESVLDINYGATETIVNSSQITSGVFLAGSTIQLKPGFKMIANKNGGNFIAFTGVDARNWVGLRVKQQKDSIEVAQISQSPEILTALDNTAQISNACFPNPTHGEFIVRMNLPKDKTVEIKVYDNFSRLVKTAITNVSETTISIAGEQAGVYFVRYSIDGKNYNYKVVKL